MQGGTDAEWTELPRARPIVFDLENSEDNRSGSFFGNQNNITIYVNRIEERDDRLTAGWLTVDERLIIGY